MLVREIMSRRAECIHPEATIEEAASRMKELDVGSLPVVENEHLMGILTDRDIAIRSIAEGNNPQISLVREAMTPNVLHCFEDEALSDAAKPMREEQIRRLPVLNRENRLVGIVSLGDLALESGDAELVGDALEGISRPSLAI